MFSRGISIFVNSLRKKFWKALQLDIVSLKNYIILVLRKQLTVSQNSATHIHATDFFVSIE